MFSSGQINSWKRFAKQVRPRGCDLLSNLPDYTDSVLVAGCQRSGTTAIANIITASDGMVNYWTERDSELEAALLLAGETLNDSAGRYCFQTTYLNECISEYQSYVGQYKLIWVVRNPHSVVYSMMYNWGNFAFNELFDACGFLDLDEYKQKKYKKFGRFGFSKLHKACHSYNVKTSQILTLKDKLPEGDVLIVEYDDLVNNANEKLKYIYGFIDLPYNKNYSAKLRTASLNKFKNFSAADKKFIQNECAETYAQVKALAV